MDQIDQLIADRLPNLSKRIEATCPQWAHVKRGHDLAHMATVLSNGNWRADRSIEQFLEGQKILVLGDDRGTLTEVLKTFGAVTTSVEINQEWYEAGRDGRWTENGKPRDDLFHGNMYWLAEPSSDLAAQIIARGPFDLIYSHYLLINGSGGERAKSSEANGVDSELVRLRLQEWPERLSPEVNLRLKGIARESYGDEDPSPANFISQYILLTALNQYLNPDGFQLHTKHAGDITGEKGVHTLAIRRFEHEDPLKIAGDPILDNRIVMSEPELQ